MMSRIWRQIFANMGYLMLLSERTFHKDLKTEKSFKICLSNQKI